MLFSAALALFMSTGSVTAQTSLPVYYETTDESDVTAIPTDGTPVCLTPAGQTDYNDGAYIGWNGSSTSLTSTESMTATYLWVFEATGEQVDGYDLYRMKIYNTNLYLRAENIDGGEDASCTFTQDVDSAFVFTALNPEDGTDDVRKYSASGGTDITITPEAWILTAKDKQLSSNGTYDAIYLCAYLAQAIYSDTNEWYIRTVTQTQPGSTLYTAITALMPYGMDAYNSGSSIGQVPEDLYNALNTAYNTANELIISESYDECNEAYVALVEAQEAAVAALAVPANAYYYIVGYRSTSGMTTDETYLTSTTSFTMPDTPTSDVADYIWYVEDAGNGDGSVYLKNYGTNLYVGYNSSNSSAIPMTEAPETTYTIDYNDYHESALGYYNIIPTSRTAVSLNVVTNSNVVFWGSLSSDEGNLWSLYAIDADAVQALDDAVEQARLNSQLTTLYKEAAEAYNDGHAYVAADGTDIFDGYFDSHGLIDDVSQLASNAVEPTEGSLDALLDIDYTTIFHSTWSEDVVPEAYHYLQVDLGSEQQTLLLKMAKRNVSGANDQGTPQEYDIYATNDTTGTWTYEGSYGVTWDIDAEVSGSTQSDYIGTSGFAMSSAYRYIRFTVTGTTTNALNGNYPYWYLSEFGAFAATEDVANSYYYEVSEATRTTFEAALAAARTEYLAQAATSATIASLQSAYDALLNELPEPTRLTDAIAAAQAAVPADSVIGDEIGMYPQDAVDALNNSISEVESSVKTVMTLAEINEGIAKLDAALEAFYATVVLPEAGKYYTIRGLSNNSSNTRAYYSMVYATSNDTTSRMYSLERVDGEDQLDPLNNLNYLWKIEEVSDSTIVLRNVGTGFYMGHTNTLNGAIHLTPEYTVLTLEPIRTVAGFFIMVGTDPDSGTDYYVNFQGQTANMVAWSSHSGADNSSLTFVEVDTENFGSETTWPVTAGVKQILTLPISVWATPGEGEGTFYNVLGYKEDGETYTIELGDYADTDVIEAGTPFVYEGVSGVSSITLITDAMTLDEMEYAAEGKLNETGAAMGSIYSTTVTERDIVVLINGSAIIRGATNHPYTLGANSGYFKNVTTTETGTSQITLAGSITSGIEDATIVDANAKVDVYTMSGVKIRENVKAADATNGLEKGLYIVGGQKTYVK